MTAHLISAPVDMVAFNRWAAERGLVRRGSFDEGFALHILLSSTFGKGVLQPFRLFWSPRRRAASLYGYSDADQAALRHMAETVATPDCLEALDAQRLLSKPMRTEFSNDQRLGFDIRVRPVRRLHRDVAVDGGRTLTKGSEVDAFVVDVRDEPLAEDGGSRERSAARGQAIQAIYSRWLAERLGDAADVDIARCRLAAFRRTRAIRGEGPGPEGPDATLQGELTVKSPDAFSHRVRHGVGRHRAYGYGMLLLRPPARATAAGA